MSHFDHCGSDMCPASSRVSCACSCARCMQSPIDDDRDHIDTLTADNRDLTTRIVGLEAERDHHRAGLVRVRAEANAALARAAELEAALRALVEAQPGCRAYRDHGSMLSGVTRGAPATVRGPGNSSTFCDEHKAEWMSELPQAQAVRAALLLLAKGG